MGGEREGVGESGMVGGFVGNGWVEGCVDQERSLGTFPPERFRSPPLGDGSRGFLGGANGQNWQFLSLRQKGSLNKKFGLGVVESSRRYNSARKNGAPNLVVVKQ